MGHKTMNQGSKADRDDLQEKERAGSWRASENQTTNAVKEESEIKVGGSRAKKKQVGREKTGW